MRKTPLLSSCSCLSNRPKLLVLSYYNPFDRSIHVGPRGDSAPLPNNRINLTARRAARYPER
jgi:hypothetical protein